MTQAGGELRWSRTANRKPLIEVNVGVGAPGHVSISSAGVNATLRAKLTTANIIALGILGIEALTPVSLAAWTPQQAKALTPAELGALTGTQIAALTPSALRALGALGIASLTASAVGGLTPAQLAALTLQQVQALSVTQIAVLSGSQVAALPPYLLNALSSGQVSALAPQDLTALGPSRVVALAPAAIAGLTPAQASALTGAQVRALIADVFSGSGAGGSSSLAAGNDTGGPSGQGGSLLPLGYLSTRGNQIVDANGNPVRIDSIGWSGTDSLTFAPYGLWQSSLEQNIQAIKADGFNTIRIPWTDAMLTASPLFSPDYAAFNPSLDPELLGLNSMQMLQVIVADAGAAGLKVILDHHDDDGGPGGWGGQQANGLWIDSGPGTDGTDGSGTTGTVTAAKFQADWVSVAKMFAGNSTVIGFDLDNEPTSAGNINWGQGGPTDIQAMYTQVGDAIQAVDPGALIIAEGPEEWSGPAPGMPAGFAEGDLSGVATDPVTLTIPNKVVYSVHEYPPDLSGNGSYSASQQIAAMNAGWGYLETEDIAPVWIGEMGSNMTNPADQAWIQTILSYMNGADGAEGGPTFTGNQQPISGSWWQWGSAPGQDPEGVETAWGSGVFWPQQQVATDQLLYQPSADGTTTPVAGASVGLAPMQVLYPAGGAVALSGSSQAPQAGDLVVATVSNLSSAPVSGWLVELNTADMIASVAGAGITQVAPGVYVAASTTNDAQIGAGGFVSFSFDVTSSAASSAIAVHIL